MSAYSTIDPLFQLSTPYKRLPNSVIDITKLFYLTFEPIPYELELADDKQFMRPSFVRGSIMIDDIGSDPSYVHVV